MHYIVDMYESRVTIANSASFQTVVTNKDSLKMYFSLTDAVFSDYAVCSYLFQTWHERVQEL